MSVLAFLRDAVFIVNRLLLTLAKQEECVCKEWWDLSRYPITTDLVWSVVYSSYTKGRGFYPRIVHTFMCINMSVFIGFECFYLLYVLQKKVYKYFISAV
jgi:hypothetical protein